MRLNIFIYCLISFPKIEISICVHSGRGQTQFQPNASWAVFLVFLPSAIEVFKVQLSSHFFLCLVTVHAMSGVESGYGGFFFISPGSAATTGILLFE